MKNLTIGILAHVDAGKTTLSEAFLYLCGKIGKLGRVDNHNAYLDTYALEKARGITIFSKQAVFDLGDTRVTLLDTPGHVDFSAEMERTLQVLDYAILVVSGADGVQGHTKTLWRLLDLYQIPVFLFVNKMDQDGTDPVRLMGELKKQLHTNCVDFSQKETPAYYDELAMCDETMMDAYLETGRIETAAVQEAVRERRVFPCFFGSALKLTGVEKLLEGVADYASIFPASFCPGEFGAKIFKITRDEQGNRLTHMKLTGGTLKVKDVLTNGIWEEKVNQIRIYSGQKYEAVSEADAGTVCAVTGLSLTRPGEGLGTESASDEPVLEPVLSYRMILPEGCDPRAILPKLRQLEEEEPELHLVWEEQLQEIQAQIMGEVQIEILQSLIASRFGIQVAFGDGKIVYKETISNMVEGVGHFEPLRHYAEVHLLLEPGVPGSGMQFGTACSEEVLSKSWQRLVLTHLEEKNHRGVLTGASVTDMKISLVAGRAHNKHTEGGDFRQATYRAVRQGLMEAESILLEPYYSFELEVPENMVGRAMSDMEKMFGTCRIVRTDGETALLQGSAPVVTMRNYHKEVAAYTKGTGRLFCSLKGYAPCHNTGEIVEETGYDPECDLQNPTGSVFCSHGAGYTVDWFEVKQHMHVESCFQPKKDPAQGAAGWFRSPSSRARDRWIGLEEIDRILDSVSYANQGKKSDWKRRRSAREDYYQSLSAGRANEVREEYLLVDGYNIIHAWPELKEHVEDNMDGARLKLIDLLNNYQGIRKCQIIVVFDAYRVQGHLEEIVDYHNIHVVYTRQAQTADQYIEKFAHDNQKKYRITVATSDGLQQMIIRGAGGLLLSARELRIELEKASERIRQQYQETRDAQNLKGNPLGMTLPEDTKRQMEELAKKGQES